MSSNREIGNDLPVKKKLTGATGDSHRNYGFRPGDALMVCAVTVKKLFNAGYKKCHKILRIKCLSKSNIFVLQLDESTNG